MSVKIYVKDSSNGCVHEYGSNRHDALILNEDGSLHYENMQNCTGTRFPDEGYTFCRKDGTDPRTDEDCAEYGVEPYLDIGGDGSDAQCATCRWYGNRRQKCTCCKDNPNLKSRYEPEKLLMKFP